MDSIKLPSLRRCGFIPVIEASGCGFILVIEASGYVDAGLFLSSRLWVGIRVRFRVRVTDDVPSSSKGSLMIELESELECHL